MVAPTTSYPACTSKAAATDESTPPDMATSTRSLTTPPRRNAEHGARSSRCVPGSRERTSSCCSAFRVPRSALQSSVQHRRQVPDLLHDFRQGSDERLHVFRRILLAE